MIEPIRDFEGIGKTCLILGGVFFLLGLSGLFGHDVTADLRELQASTGMAWPPWFPVSLFDHYRLLCALQLPPNALMAVAGWGLLKKTSWSIAALKLTAWVFLLATLALGVWIIGALGPAGASSEPADQALRRIFAWTMALATLAMAGSVAWFLWRLRRATA